MRKMNPRSGICRSLMFAAQNYLASETVPAAGKCLNNGAEAFTTLFYYSCSAASAAHSITKSSS